MVFSTIGLLLVVAACLGVVARSGASGKEEEEEAYLQGVSIVESFPHKKSAFTQGLCMWSGQLFESDGLYGSSSVRLVDVATGESTVEIENHNRHFGEGLAAIGDVLLQLTWREKVMHEYCFDGNKITLRRTLEQPFRGEGWGVTYDPDVDHVYFTDGSSLLHTFKRKESEGIVSYEKVRDAIKVVDARLSHLPIDGLNEMEFVKGEIWANVYPMRHHRASNCIARIEPTTGNVKGWIDANVLLTLQSHRVQSHSLNYVFNGIAYQDGGNDERSKIFVTGKQWDFLYDVDLAPFEPPSSPENHVRKLCGLYIPSSSSSSSVRDQVRGHKKGHPPLRSGN